MKKIFLLLLCILGFINSQAQKLTLRDLELLHQCDSPDCEKDYLQQLGYVLKDSYIDKEKSRITHSYEPKKGKSKLVIVIHPDNMMVLYVPADASILQELTQDVEKRGVKIPGPNDEMANYRMEGVSYIVGASYDGKKLSTISLSSFTHPPSQLVKREAARIATESSFRERYRGIIANLDIRPRVEIDFYTMTPAQQQINYEKNLLIRSHNEKVYFSALNQILGLVKNATAADMETPYFHGAVISMLYFNSEPANDLYTGYSSNINQFYKDITKIIFLENKYFIRFDKASNKEVVSTFGWTQPEVIDDSVLVSLGIEVFENPEEGSQYKLDDLITHLPGLLKKYGKLSYGYIDASGKHELGLYDKKFVDYIELVDDRTTDGDNKILVRNKRWPSFIESLPNYVSDPFSRGKLYYWANKPVEAIVELVKAKEKCRSDDTYELDEINKYLFTAKTQALLLKNPVLKKGLPNKILPPGWKIPLDMGDISVVADFNEDGLLDEVLLLSQKEKAKNGIHLDITAFVFLNNPTGKYTIQRINTAQLRSEENIARHLSLHDIFDPIPVGGFNAILEGADNDWHGIGQNIFRWDKKTKKMIPYP